jgi:hypothetical protein
MAKEKEHEIREKYRARHDEGACDALTQYALTKKTS